MRKSSPDKNSLDQRLKFELDKRDAQGNLRRLSTSDPALIDFCSNDYLGLAARSAGFQFSSTDFSRGASAARLLRGNSAQFEQLEKKLAGFFNSEAALLFSSGYLANLAFFSTLPSRHERVLFDESAHASIKDGTRLGFSHHHSFKHNSTQALEKRISNLEPGTWIALEGLYSMDGDFAPLKEILELAERYGGRVVLDEAHSVGIIGEKGRGLADSLGVADKLSARIVTFGKAFGAAGAAILGSQTLIDYLVNFARPFIYTTAMPPTQLALIEEGMDLVSNANQERTELLARSRFFSNLIQEHPYFLGAADSPIKGFKVAGAAAARALALELQHSGFDVRAICSPTVPSGSERLRIVLHSFNSELDIERLIQALIGNPTQKVNENELCEPFSSQA